MKPSDDQGDARRRGRPTETQHLFAAGLAAQGITLADWARKHGYPRVQAQKWMMPPPHGRRIPERAAKLIEAELNVPANEEVWTTGIKRD